MVSSRRFSGILACALGIVAAAMPAVADDYDSAFERRFAGAGNRDALDGFVIEAVNAGQYDQAIASLEELLFANPNDIDARLALARLYYNLGAYDLAAAHVEQASLISSGPEVERLRAQVERGASGIDVDLAVTFGGGYTQARLETATASDSHGVGTPYVAIDGRVTRTLDTASRDTVSVGGQMRYNRGVADTDFDGDLDGFDNFGFRGDATFSKGLPDIADTLRLDMTGYGLARNYGGGRDLRELGAEAALSIRPTVETELRAFAGYGWLGASRNIYSDDRLRYGVSGEVRVAPRVAIGAHATGYSEWGTTPTPFTAFGSDYGFTAHGYEVGAAVSHLLHIFGDGRRWQHQAGVNFSEERILDYASVGGSQADLIDRKAWEVYWDHSVQIATRADLTFGVSYGQDDISDTLLFVSQDRHGEYWGFKAGLTFRFQ